MEDLNIYRVLEKDGTTFLVTRGREAGFEGEFFVKGKGRLNFIRPVQSLDALFLRSGSYFMFLKYIPRGPFTLIEEGEEYFFEPSSEGWIVKHRSGIFELKGEEEVLNIIIGNISVKEILSNQKVIELISEESKKALTTLSEMISKNVFDYEKFERIKRYAEEVNDERVKDMLMIVQKRFRREQGSKESKVVVHVIE
ncbi:MAG: hypothetical protein QXP55_01100 [Nitrososphaerales archaeon]